MQIRRVCCVHYCL